MELLIAFFVAIGLISSDGKLSEKEIEYLKTEKHSELSAKYGDEYLKIVGTNENERD
jgi:hypothetical protein